MFDTADEPELTPLTGRIRRTELTHGAWVDHLPGWLRGSDEVLERLLQDVPWRAERRQMYDRQVDVPRLLCWYSGETPFPHPILTEARTALNSHYQSELGEPLVTAGLCLYRDGADSVAWHGDTIGRGSHSDTMVAILSVGSARALTLRPRPTTSTKPDPNNPASSETDPTHPESGTPVSTKPDPARTGGLKFPLGHGDLIVMGGSCQRSWEHAIPKTSRAVGPRISIQFRPVGVA